MSQASEAIIWLFLVRLSQGKHPHSFAHARPANLSLRTVCQTIADKGHFREAALTFGCSGL